MIWNFVLQHMKDVKKKYGADGDRRFSFCALLLLCRDVQVTRLIKTGGIENKTKQMKWAAECCDDNFSSV